MELTFLDLNRILSILSTLGHTCATLNPIIMYGVLDIIDKWRSSTLEKDNILFEVFSRIFKITRDTGRMVIPSSLRLKAVHEWMQGNEKLVDMMEFQEILFVYNLVTLDTNIFNPLRAIRPTPTTEHSDVQQMEILLQESVKHCDFCSYKDFTAEDVFGRFESEFAYTVANAFKFDAWHSMVVFRTHHPIKWTLSELNGSFELILKWFERVHNLSDVYRYPVILWDMLPSSGASQIHPHIHMMLSQDRYHGELERWHLSAQLYKDKYCSSYWTDLLKVSSALGLTVTLNDATGIINMTPKLDHEVILHCEHPCRSLWKLLYCVIQTFYTKLGIYSFSMAMVLPPWGSEPDPNKPVFARIVPRGPLSCHKNDVSSLQLFASPSVSVDPLKTASLLQTVVDQYMKPDDSCIT